MDRAGAGGGAGEEAFPGRRSTGLTPLGRSLGLSEAVPTLSAAAGRWAAAGWRPRVRDRAGLEAASGTDGVYESWAQLLDPPFLAPRLHVWGTLGEFALALYGPRVSPLNWAVGHHAATKRFPGHHKCHSLGGLSLT